MEKHLYSYEGPVLEFDMVIMNKWKSKTYAVNNRRALCNLKHQFTLKYKRTPNTKLALPGKLIREDENELCG